jgi:nucleotide-binding universal stress UspA family protein
MSTQHILVPIDFSAYADRALDFAMALASKLPARLTLLHVIHIIPLGLAEGGAPLPYTYIETLEAEVQQSLETYSKRVQEVGLDCDTMVMHGIPFQSIIDVARDKQVDLIIMGTHGRTGLKHILLGSVAEKVVRLAPCPVLITRGPADTSEP